MAHESFEDDATAKVMNTHFVNVKVTAEERPDLDKIYQVSHQLLARRPGGWPLTMFLTPDDRTPFFGGTYFPPSPRHGLPSFRDLLLRVVDFLGAHGDESRQAERVAARCPRPGGAGRGRFRNRHAWRALELAMAGLRNAFDARDGGSAGRRVPHPTNIERCFRRHRDPRDLHMGVHTLAKMALGGIYDHLGGGFCRYSVDGEWMIPHFEKMLYDNGPLLALAAQAARLGAGNEELFERTARETGRWRSARCRLPRAASIRRSTPTPRVRRAVLPLDPGRGPRGARRGRVRRRRHVVRSRPPAELRGQGMAPAHVRRARGPRREARRR